MRFLRTAVAVALLSGSTLATGEAAALPPSPAAAMDLSPPAERIAADCTAAVASLQTRLSAIAALPRDQRTFTSVSLASQAAFDAASDALAADLFMGDVGVSKAQRDAAASCRTALTKVQAEQGSRPEAYAALTDVERSGTATTAPQKKLLDEQLAAAKRGGASLDPAKRATYLALNARLTDLRRTYSQNINETRTPLRFSAAQLAGLAPDRLNAFAKEGATYIVPATEANYVTITSAVSVEDTRKALYTARFNQMAAQNDPVFEEVVAKRAQVAHLLGYRSWAAYVLERRMAKSPAKVDAFLADLDAKLLPAARGEAEELRALKARETGNAGARLEVWDVNYYTDMLVRAKYAVDSNAVRAYFPVTKTVPAIFDVYAQLLGVTFAKRDDAKTWAPNVQAFAVSDTATGRYLGDIYLDLFPREGKNAHFHSATFWRHRTGPDGTIRPALNAIVGEFAQPAPGQTPLLTHREVVTFFHEFGHSIAALVKTSPYGLDFTWDFVEAPSQMLENWVWDPAVLKRITADATGAPMPDDMIAKLRTTRAAEESALSWTRQIALASADMAYHESDAAPKPNETWAAVYSRTTPLAFPADIHFEANFNHIVGSGYSAGYYGYLWSKVYAQDMFARFSRDGLLNPSTGAAYRRILENAGLEDADVQVARFVGHPLDPAPFYATLGVPVTTGR
jgi:thimet oligopeptidase